MGKFDVTTLLVASLVALSVDASNVVRGVNLGGWLVTEPWYVYSCAMSDRQEDSGTD